MLTPSQEMFERHAAVLARLTALGLALAERVQAQAMAVEDVEEIDTLSGAFHRISRSVRMSIALEAKLARALRDEARAAARADDDAAGEARPPLDREFENVVFHPVYDPDDADDLVPIGWTEREEEAWAVNSRHPLMAGRAPLAVAPEDDVFAARVERLRGELADLHGPTYADVHAAAQVCAAIVREARARLRPALNSS
jgi:hypothetical protein